MKRIQDYFNSIADELPPLLVLSPTSTIAAYAVGENTNSGMKASQKCGAFFVFNIFKRVNLQFQHMQLAKTPTAA